MRQLVLYIHGKGGNAMEADHYKTLFAGYDMIGIDYHADNPWDAISEFKEFFHRYRKGYDSIVLIANSIGAYFSMCALNNEQVDKAFFISPSNAFNPAYPNGIFSSFHNTDAVLL